MSEELKILYLRDKMGNGICLCFLFGTENHKQKRGNGTDI